MVTKKTVWIAKGGASFESEEEAVRHETALDLSDDIAKHMREVFGDHIDVVNLHDALEAAQRAGWYFARYRTNAAPEAQL